MFRMFALDLPWGIALACPATAPHVTGANSELSSEPARKLRIALKIASTCDFADAQMAGSRSRKSMEGRPEPAFPEHA
jgi:hypothetical protein